MDLTLHLTHRCNLACSYCYAAPEQGGGDMGEEVLDAALALTASEAPPRGYFTVTYFGGEPLLRLDLIRRGVSRSEELAAGAGVEVSHRICTNGLLLDEATLTYCDDHGVGLSLSFDGVREAHDAHRRFSDGRGSYEAALSRLEVALARLPYTTVQLVVTPETATYLPASVELLLDRGVRYLLTTLDYTAAWDEGSVGELATAYDAVAKLYERRTLAEQKFYLSCLDGKISSRTKGPLRRHERCSAGVGQVSVAASGRIYPCVQFVGDDSDHRHAIGHVLEGGFDDARRANLAAEGEREKVSCTSCAVADRCNNWCACLNWQTTGRLDQVSPLQCTHERLLLGAADRAAERLYKRRSPLFLRKHYDDAHPFLSYLEDLDDGLREDTRDEP